MGGWGGSPPPLTEGICEHFRPISSSNMIPWYSKRMCRSEGAEKCIFQNVFFRLLVPISFRSSAYWSHCMVQQYSPWFETNAWSRVPLARPVKSRASVRVSVWKNRLKVFCFCNLIIMENFILAGFVSWRHGIPWVYRGYTVYRGNGQTTPERGEMFCLSILHHLSW